MNFKFNFNPKISFNFSGEKISSNSGLLPIKEFADKLRLEKWLNEYLIPNKKHRKHSFTQCCLQKVYAIISGHEDNSDSQILKLDPVFQSILEKDAASQPTLSRFENSAAICDRKNLQELNLDLTLSTYSDKDLQEMTIDTDSMDIIAHGHQIGSGYHGYYEDNIYHPIFCFNAATGDCLKAQLRKGVTHTANKIVVFLSPVIDKLKQKNSDIHLKLRGDAGMSMPALYEYLEQEGVNYYIRLKRNPVLEKLYEDVQLEISVKNKNISYGEFFYKADSWTHSRRVIVKREIKAELLFPLIYFVVTNDSKGDEEEIIEFYQDRGIAETYLKEGKLGFAWDRLSCHSFTANHFRLQLAVLAYTLINLMKRLIFKNTVFFKSSIDTLRWKFIKLGSVVVSHARKIYFKFSKSYPYIDDFLQILNTIHCLNY